MAPVVIGQQPRTIIITPNMFSGDDSRRKILDSGELPTYAVGLFESNGPGPRKRKRLTHLTPEEKVMRRKLKNRVAAQTARDRKKARLETLEEAVAKIHEQTKKLLDVNSQLIVRTEALERENTILRQRLGLDANGSFIDDKKAELSIIKKEFNEITTLQNNRTKDRMNDNSSDDDEEYCILTPYEGDNVTVDERSRTDISMLKASKCVSPVPAAFGERLKEGPNPQQQEAVNSAKLIRLQAKSNEISTRFQTQTITTNPQKTIQILRPSSEPLKQSIHRSASLPICLVKKEMPLDLRKY